jgi:uncharacterized membrane protein
MMVLGLSTTAPGARSERPIGARAMADAVVWVEAQLATGTSLLDPPLPDAVRVDLPAPEVWRPDPARVRRTTAALWRSVPALVLIVMFNVAVATSTLLASRVFAVAFLLLVPGTVLLAASATRPRSGAVRGALACAASAIALMLLALSADLALPYAGVARPLARTPMLIAVDVVVCAALAFAARRREPLTWLFGARSPSIRQVASGLVIAAVPSLAAAGAQAVAHGRGGAVATVALIATAVLLLVAVWFAERLPAWALEAGLYAAGLALVYSFSLSGDRLFGWDIQQEFAAFSTTFGADAWHTAVDGDPYRSMLSITALPAVLARVSGMSGESIFRGVFPMLFAAFPVLTFATAARWVSRTAAAGASAFVIVQLAFSQQLPAIARQEIALVLFGVLVAVGFDDRLPVGYRRCVVVAAGSSLAFAHYSTAYVTSMTLLAGWALLTGVRLVWRRSRQAPRERVLVLPVALAVLGCTVLWNFGITRSGENVAQFAAQMAERGPEFLPQSQGGSLVERWVNGNAPHRISGEEYARRIDLIYDASAPWLERYPDGLVAANPVVDAATPQLNGLVPDARPLHDTLLVAVSQGFVALTGLGAVVFAWRRRREHGAARELALVAVAALAFVAAMRVSGVAAEAYNQERAQIHAAAVLSVGLAAVVGWFIGRWRRRALVALSFALGVVFLASSGLAAPLVGGPAPANLTGTGDARERFAVVDAEIATAAWLAQHRYPDSIVTADRYAMLRIWAAATDIPTTALQGALTPATLDRNSYVYASVANITGGRARGAIGADFTVYEFPEEFLDANKARIYSTGTTAVFR